MHHFLYPPKLQALEINYHMQASLGLSPGRYTKGLADTQKLQKKKKVHPL